MKHQVIIERKAAADITEYGLWIAEQGSPENAARWVDSIEKAIASLATMPHRCPQAPEAAVFEEAVRQLQFKSHRILFVIRKKTVHVLHVRHGARLPFGSDGEN